MPFDTPETVSRPQRTRHCRKQPDGHIPRPPNAFILFRSSFIRSQRVSSEVETSHSTLSKIIGLTWQNLSAGERRLWHSKARDAVEEHRRKFPTYAFRPVNRRARPAGGASTGPDKDAKRKMREHCVDDPARCEKIAALLVEGKQGRELDAAVHEFDSQRVPSVVTRFEPPITATAYRRSSSAPAPDTEPPTAFLVNNTPTVGHRRRSSSSGPPSRPSVECDAVPEPDASPDVSPENSPLDNFVSPWTLASEHNGFDFNGFSFAPTDPPAFDLTCDPVWSNPNPDFFPIDDPFKFASAEETRVAPDAGMDIGAFIAEDWARALQSHSEWQNLSYADNNAYPAHVSGGLETAYHMSAPVYFQQQPCFIETPQPHIAQIDTGLVQLMASLDA
ncbi:hypothetical protein B0H11DRAFT_1250645 [Mycena galericulata]|nr:hypothetical protein B0H11DRAFT_1250645 [Mycena galericulata]